MTTSPGDLGTSDACRGERVVKDDPVFDALGTLDELMSVINVARSQVKISNLDEMDRTFVDDMLCDLLKTLSEDVCVSLLPEKFKDKVNSLCEDLNKSTEALEETVKGLNFSPLTRFLLSEESGNLPVDHLQVCRAVCRRAERTLIHAFSSDSLSIVVPPDLRYTVMKYMNRCSSFLFAFALFLYERGVLKADV